MMYDYELVLIDESYTKDIIGNQIATKTETNILCAVKSVGRSEFYNSAQAGLRPEIIFVIHPYEYNNQKKVKFNNQNYDVIRTYTNNFEELELVCTTRISSK